LEGALDKKRKKRTEVDETGWEGLADRHADRKWKQEKDEVKERVIEEVNHERGRSSRAAKMKEQSSDNTTD